MKSTPTISLISGQNVPYNISYFPSTLPSATVHGDESSPVTSLGLETIKLDSRNSNFDRGTQTSFKYVPQKKKSQEEKINQLSSKSRHEQEGTAGAQTDFQAEENARKSAPLNRSASYEKAILSSMKDIDYNINIDNKSPDYCKSNLTGNSKTSSELSPGSPSSNKSSSRGLVNVSEAFTNRRGTFEKWKRRASGKKTSSSDAEEDKGMELLKYEQFEYYNLNDEERNLNRNTDEGSEVKGEESGCLKKRKTSSDSSTLVIGTKQKSDVQNELSEARKDRAPIVIGVKEKPSKEGEKELEKESKAGEPPLTDSGTRTTSRAKEMLQKAYTCYPEGGGGGSEYPYLREMKERLLIQKDTPLDAMEDPARIDAENQLLEVHQTPVGTVVKLNADGYGSHTSPTHRVESFYTGTLESRKTNAFEFFPKNAKTSSFITLSLLYATLLVVVCLGFVLSEVLTHNVPLYYYEAFFTYLYGISIFFLLYVFCYLLSGSTREPKPPKNQVFMVRLSMLSLVTPLCSCNNRCESTLLFKIRNCI